MSGVKRWIATVLPVSLIAASFAADDGKKPVTFHVTMRGEIEDTVATQAGFHTSHFHTTHLGFTDLEASDGENVSVHHGYFDTADEATRFFEWTLDKRAAQIVVQGEKMRDGKTVGRRAEYLLKTDNKTKTWVVMWTDAAILSLVYAPTLECALEVEKPSGN